MKSEAPLGGGARGTVGQTSTIISPTGDNVPSHRPWARRPDALEVEIRYRRSVHYWLRRPMCVHGRRADECAS